MRSEFIGVDMASGPDRTVIILHPCVREIDPDYVAELEAMENVELIWQEQLPTGDKS
jgi:hypothetical protein